MEEDLYNVKSWIYIRSERWDIRGAENRKYIKGNIYQIKDRIYIQCEKWDI